MLPLLVVDSDIPPGVFEGRYAQKPYPASFFNSLRALCRTTTVRTPFKFERRDQAIVTLGEETSVSETITARKSVSRDFLWLTRTLHRSFVFPFPPFLSFAASTPFANDV